MKTFFILLLLSNIIFAVLQWLFPYDQVFSHSRPMIAAEQLQLLDEVAEQSIQPEAGDVVKKPKKLSKNVEPQKLCYTLGPFKDEQQAQEVVLKFEQNNLKMSTRPSVEKEYLGMMVFIDGHNSRQEARATAKSLAEQGIRDYMIVNEDNKEHALSLGVFGLKKNADRRVERITALGYQAKAEPRYRDRTIYWLDYAEQETQPLVDLIDRLKSEQGVSRISRFCG